MEQYNELLSNIGQVIFKERKSQKLTRAALAEKAGLSIQTINKVEHGQNTKEPLNKSPSFSAERENRRLPLGSSDSVGK